MSRIGVTPEGRLLSRNSRLCTSCCGTVVPPVDCLCGWDGYTDCNGDFVPAGSYGRRFRLDIQINADASWAERNGFSDQYPNDRCAESSRIEYEENISAEYGPDETPGGSPNSCRVRTITSTLTIRQFCDGNLCSEFQDTYTYPNVGDDIRRVPEFTVPDRGPITAQLPELINRFPDPGGSPFFEYGGFGVNDDDGTFGASEFFARQDGLIDTDTQVRKFCPVSRPVDDFTVYVNADDGPGGNQACSFGIAPGTFFTPNINADSLYMGVGGPNLTIPFSQGSQCEGEFRIVKFSTGLFTSSGTITPFSSSYQSDAAAGVLLQEYRCINGFTQLRIQADVTAAVSTSYTANVTTIEGCDDVPV